MTTSHCALCSTSTNPSAIIDGNHHFCCSGCQAVFTILSAKNLLHQYQETPIFQQAVRYGLISNPALLEQIRQKETTLEECEKLYFEVQEMWCPSCAEVIKLIISQEKGVKNCIVDYSTDLAAIEFSPKQISKEYLFQLIKNLGYQPNQTVSLESGKMNKALAIRLCIAAFCSLNIMMFSYPLYATYFDYDGDNYGFTFAWLSLIFALPVLLYSCWPIFKRFANSFKVGIYGMETLVVIGVLTSFGLSLYELLNGGTRVYFDSMTVIVVFVLLGKVIETKAKFSAKESLFRLNRTIPKRGRKRFADYTTAFVPAKDITIGDVLVVLSGEKIILDGVVIEGNGSCDESLMTGESLPISKSPGLSVISGTILQNGWIAYQVTTTSEQSTLQKIVDMVSKDLPAKGQHRNIVDYIVRYFVPFVLLLSVLAFIYSYLSGNTIESSIIRAISVLLISCPCAIGIAAPLAESQLLQGLAKLGAIVRNRACLNLLGRETVFVFDKTGTITEGCFSVVSGLREEIVLGSLAAQSTHPMSLAIATACGEKRVSFSRIHEHAGKGIQGVYNEDVYYLGSSDFLKSFGIEIRNPPIDTFNITSNVYFAKNREFITTLVLADRLRPDASATIAKLKPAILLSGDSITPVKKIAEQCAFDSWYSSCTPLQKREVIEELRHAGKIVCMLGDGINDALALTRAHIGISVLNAADISVQVSDILLTNNQLSFLPKIRSLARFGRKIMHQNLFWAFFYNIVGMGLAFFGLLSPIFAAFAMVVSSLMVLGNAKRLR